MAIGSLAVLLPCAAPLLTLASSGNKAPCGKIMPLVRTEQSTLDPVVGRRISPPLLCRPSPKNLLGLERDHETALPKRALQSERLIRLLAISVEFVAEDPDDPTTTGNGLMDLRDTAHYNAEHGHYFDSAPHDSAYFGKHIEALHNYWQTVSNGKISIVGTVYPPPGQRPYTLPQTMAHYGEQDPAYGLTEFYFDAFRTADTLSPEINFAEYDAYCVFHAGSDRQSDWMWDTPNDLYTGFILLGAPIPVDFGTHLITEGMIMPETVIQDNRITVMNAVMAHEFGHQLGLVDLYSTETFITQVGNFSLMDNNAINIGGEIEAEGRTRLLFGALPVFPDAWSRAYLGFIEIDTVYSAPEVFVYAAELENDPPQAVLVPITRAEYYLVENRRINIDDDPITAILADSATNVILGPVDSDRNYSREYDYLLPGSGILIWHVDEMVAFEDVFPEDDVPNNFLANTLQWNCEKRFLSLVEADMTVSFRCSEFSDFGTASDMFASPSRRFFTPDSPISTSSNSGARTGIKFKINSPEATVMDFSVENDQTLPGFPVWCGPGPEYFSPAVIDIDADATPEIIVGSGTRLFGWRFDGTPIYDNGIYDTFISLNGDSVTRRAAVMAEMPRPLLGPPVVGFIDGIGHANAVAVDADNFIHYWRLTDFDQDKYADVILETASERALAGPTIVFEQPGSLIGEIAFALDLGGLLIMDGNARDSTLNFDVARVTAMAGTTLDNAYYLFQDGLGTWYIRTMSRPNLLAQLDTDTAYGPVLGDLDRDGRLDIICAGSNGTVWAFDSLLQPLAGFPADMARHITADPVIGDIDGDGYLEIVVVSDNYIHAVNFNGTLQEDYPIAIDRHHPTGPINVPPIIVGAADGHPTEIIVPTAEGELASVGVREFGLSDFTSRPVGAPIVGSPAFAYDPNTETAAVFAVGSDGFLYGFALPPSAAPYHGLFSQRGYDGGRTNVYPLDSLPEPVQFAGMLVENSVYAYPNPAAGDQVFVHYELGGPAEIHVDIYDIAGGLVDQLSGTGDSGTDNEIVWNCAAVASGVYFCKIVARTSEGESETIFCPVAIAR
jgi:M6 family metalloprotease-like protein